MNSKIALVLLIAVITIVIFGNYIILRKGVNHFDGITAKQLTDSLKAHNKLREQQLSLLKDKYKQDSVRINSVQNQINKVPDLVKEISKSYDKKRNHINSLSTDEQVSYMSDWLSKDTSIRE
jgi:hypothetical protein